MQQRLAKYRRDPAAAQALAGRQITSRSLEIIATLERYRFLPTSLVVQLVAGNQRITQRHLQTLYQRSLVNRFSFPRIGNPGEFYYYLDSPEALTLLVEHNIADPEHLDWDGVKNNRAKAYSEVHDPKKSDEMQGRLLFLQHEVMISRFHCLIELACRTSGESIELTAWRQGPRLWNSVEVPRVFCRNGVWINEEETEVLPHRPDAFFTLRFPDEPEGQQYAHFFYEADRKTTSTKKFTTKLRAHFHFIVKQRRHQDLYGIQRVRAVLIETIDGSWAEELRSVGRHPTISGSKPSPLFWFTTSELFKRNQEQVRGTLSYISKPEIVMKRIWASPVDDTLYSLLD